MGLETKLPSNKLETDLKLIYDNEIIDTWVNKKWPIDMLSEVNWLVKEQARNNNYLKKRRFNLNRSLWVSSSYK